MKTPYHILCKKMFFAFSLDVKYLLFPMFLFYLIFSVLSALISGIIIKGIDTYYWTNDQGNSEIDFVVDNGSAVVPIEVKAETNLKAKSLKTYKEMFSPEISIRASMSDYKKEGWLVSLPLYAISELPSQIK